MEMFDCWMTEGEIDPKRIGHYLENEKLKTTKVMHNVTLAEAQRWRQSTKVHEWAMDVEARGLVPSYYFTISSED